MNSNHYLLNKLLSFIDRDKVTSSSSSNDNNIDYSYPKIHETVDLICSNCRAPKLYKVGYSDFDFTLYA